jgi:hypothetical protein
MAHPANQQTAARAAHALLVRRLPGSRRGSVRAHLQRAARVVALFKTLTTGNLIPKHPTERMGKTVA